MRQVRIEIGRAAKALNQGDGAAGGFISLDAGLFDEMRVECVPLVVVALEMKSYRPTIFYNLSDRDRFILVASRSRSGI